MAGVGDILDQVHQLPALPSSVSRIIAALLSDDTQLYEIERIVRLDEAVTATVLRYANSVQYGSPGRVFSLKESIVRLGAKMLLRIALQHQISPAFLDGGTAYGLARGALWRGTLAGAIAAEGLACANRFPDPDLAFLCALMRDIGKLVIDMCAAPRQLAAAAELVQPDECFLDRERELLGTDHAQLGAALARRWNLPRRIADAIRYHHRPPAAPPDHDRLFDIVHAADVLCLWTGLATGCDGLQYPLTPHVRDQLLGKRDRAEYYMTAMWTGLTEYEAAMDNDALQGMSA